MVEKMLKDFYESTQDLHRLQNGNINKSDITFYGYKLHNSMIDILIAPDHDSDHLKCNWIADGIRWILSWFMARMNLDNKMKKKV